MIRTAILVCVVATVASLPVEPVYTINVDGPDGRHVQMGEPGKAVSGYYTMRSLDGQMEYKTMYEADDKGFRATGDHLPGSSAVAAARTLENEPSYVFKYDAKDHSHYQMGEPGKAVQGSFMYYDAQGRSQRVNYKADENGYRVEPPVEEEPVKVVEGLEVEANVVEPAVDVAPVESSADPVAQSVVAEPVAVAEPAPAADPVVVAEPAPADPVAVAEPVVVAEPVPAADPVAVAEPVVVAEPAPAADPVVVAEPAPAAEPVVVAVAVAEPVVAEPAPAADPVVAAEPEVVAEPAKVADPVAVAEPVAEVAAEPVVDSVKAENDAAPETAAAPVVDSVRIEIEPEVSDQVEPSADEESKKQQQPLLALAVPHYGGAYYGAHLPYVQPVYRYRPYAYGYGYHYGYPFAGSNYIYAY